MNVRTAVYVLTALLFTSGASIAQEPLGNRLDGFVSRFNSTSSVMRTDVLFATTKCGEAKVRTCQIISPGNVAGVLVAAEDRDTLRSVMLFMGNDTDAEEYAEAISVTLAMFAGEESPQDHAGALRVLIQGILDLAEKTAVMLGKAKWSLSYSAATGYMLLISGV